MAVPPQDNLAYKDADAAPTAPDITTTTAQPPQLRVVTDAPKSYVYPIHRVYAIFQSYFRPRRKRAFVRRFPEAARGASVVDLGGTVSWWTEDFPGRPNLTVVNIDDDHRDIVLRHGFRFERADARSLPFADKQFDLAFSNSVIEHVGGFEDQKRFAAEAMRCARKLYLQTPNKWFPIEPHYMACGIQWLPFGVARKLMRRCSLWGLVAKPTQAQIDEMLRTTRLLSRSQLRELFPTAKISSERFFGLTKSFIVTIE